MDRVRKCYNSTKRLIKTTSLSALKPNKEVNMSLARSCKFQPCDRQSSVRSYCKAHYSQLLTGKPLKIIKTSRFYISKTKIPEYKIWVNMRYRCNKVGSAHYMDYGGRGIKVCERWNDFDLFLKDMGSRPSKNHSLDRIDVNGDYSPENCRWADWKTQNRNTRKRVGNTSGVKGIFWDKRLNAWQAKIKIDGKKIHLKSTTDIDIAIAERLRAEYKYWGYVSSASQYLVTDKNKEFIYGTN